jgi:hypothetical protein
MIESSNSYMLIYALKDRETLAQPQLPASATAFVEQGTPLQDAVYKADTTSA